MYNKQYQFGQVSEVKGISKK